MDASHLFTAALRLRSPWRVGSADFRDADGDGREPHITIGFEPGRGFMLLFEAWVWLYRLCSWMMHSRLEPMKELARLFRRHFATIIYLTCGSSHINGSSDCDAQEQLRARLDCLLEPTGAGIDDLVDTPAGIWWGFRWHTGFSSKPRLGNRSGLRRWPGSYVNRLPSEPGQNPLSRFAIFVLFYKQGQANLRRSYAP